MEYSLAIVGQILKLEGNEIEITGKQKTKTHKANIKQRKKANKKRNQVKKSKNVNNLEPRRSTRTFKVSTTSWKLMQKGKMRKLLTISGEKSANSRRIKRRKYHKTN